MPDHPSHLKVHGQSISHNGPNKDKPRPTWTRLSRMDCGFNDFKKSRTTTTLGKRSLLHESEQDHAERVEFQLVKRGKGQEVSQDSETAGVLEHLCRAQ